MALYTISASSQEDIESKLSKLATKAARYNKSLQWSFGAPYIKRVDLMSDGRAIGSRDILALDLEINADLIKRDGYTVIARLERLEGGNIVYPIGVNAEDVKSYQNMALRCDHCGTNHQRTHAYIISKDEREYMVGRSCIREYTGIDPALIGYYNELVDIVMDEEPEHMLNSGRAIRRAYNPLTVLALAFDLYNERGYIKSEEINSNKSQLMEIFRDADQDPVPMPNSLIKAEALKKLLDDDNFGEGNENLKIILSNGYCASKHFGYLAYGPKLYDNLMERVKREQERAERISAEAEASKYIGSVGDRIEIEFVSLNCIASWEGEYGTTNLYKFVDKLGNVLMWFASKFICPDDIPALTKVKGTIKAHNERDGIKQTIITRCKVS